MTRQEVATHLGLTVQAVQKIEERALAKMRRGFEALGIDAACVASILNPRDASSDLTASFRGLLRAAFRG